MRSKLSKNSINFLDHDHDTVAGALLLVVIVLLIGSFAAGCAGKFPPVKTYDQAAKEVDAKGPLVTPPIEEREGYKPGKSEVITSGTAAPSNGILIDRDRAAYLAAIKGERDRRRKELAVERRKAAIERLIYESTIANLQARAKEQNNWWHSNKAIIGLVTGATIMGGLIIGLVYGLTKGNGISTSTNTMILQRIPAR